MSSIENNQIILRPVLQLTDSLDVLSSEETVLEGYLKTELDNMTYLDDKIQWRDAKEQLGAKLITRDLELNNYKNKYYGMVALNIALAGAVVAMKFWGR